MRSCASLLGAVSLLLQGLSGAAVAAEWPTAGWPESAPAEQGLDAAVLERLDAEFAAGRACT